MIPTGRKVPLSHTPPPKRLRKRGGLPWIAFGQRRSWTDHDLPQTPPRSEAHQHVICRAHSRRMSVGRPSAEKHRRGRTHLPALRLSHDADGRAAAARDRHHYERRSEWKADTTRTPTRTTLLSALMCSVATIVCGDAWNPRTVRDYEGRLRQLR